MKIFKCYFTENEKRFSVETYQVDYIKEVKRGFLAGIDNNIDNFCLASCMSGRNIGGAVFCVVLLSFMDVERFICKIKSKILEKTVYK